MLHPWRWSRMALGATWSRGRRPSSELPVPSDPLHDAMCHRDGNEHGREEEFQGGENHLPTVHTARGASGRSGSLAASGIRGGNEDAAGRTRERRGAGVQRGLRNSSGEGGRRTSSTEHPRLQGGKGGEGGHLWNAGGGGGLQPCSAARLGGPKGSALSFRPAPCACTLGRAGKRGAKKHLLSLESGGGWDALAGRGGFWALFPPSFGT